MHCVPLKFTINIVQGTSLRTGVCGLSDHCDLYDLDRTEEEVRGPGRGQVPGGCSI